MEHLVHKLSCLMVDKMQEVIPSLCYGCLAEKSSQKHHDLCLLAEKEELFYRTFTPAWEKIDFVKEIDVLKKLVCERMEFATLKKTKSTGKRRRLNNVRSEVRTQLQNEQEEEEDNDECQIIPTTEAKDKETSMTKSSEM